MASPCGMSAAGVSAGSSWSSKASARVDDDAGAAKSGRNFGVLPGNPPASAGSRAGEWPYLQRESTRGCAAVCEVVR